MICTQVYFFHAPIFIMHYSLFKQYCFFLILAIIIQALGNRDSFIVILSSQGFWIACGLLRRHQQSCHCLEQVLCWLCILYIATYRLMDWFENDTGSFKISCWDWPGIGFSEIWGALTETCADAYQFSNSQLFSVSIRISRQSHFCCTGPCGTEGSGH